MTSINTNTGAMAAIQTLRNIDVNLRDAQNQVSTGYRINSAADNASYWSIATNLRSDNSALSVVVDALGLSSGKVDTALTALESSIEVVKQIYTKLASARDPSVDKDKINTEITALKDQLKSITMTATFGSENWMYNASGSTAQGTKNMLSGFSRDSTGQIVTNTIDFDTSKCVLIDDKTATSGILTGKSTIKVNGANVDFYLVKGANGAAGTEVSISSATTNANLDGMIAAVDLMSRNMETQAATLGATSNRITMQTTYVKKLIDTANESIGRLVDANLDEQSTRLKTLQTQQQLAIQALTISNTNAQVILQLFR